MVLVQPHSRRTELHLPGGACPRRWHPGGKAGRDCKRKEMSPLATAISRRDKQELTQVRCCRNSPSGSCRSENLGSSPQGHTARPSGLRRAAGRKEGLRSWQGSPQTSTAPPPREPQFQQQFTPKPSTASPAGPRVAARLIPRKGIAEKPPQGADSV